MPRLTTQFCNGGESGPCPGCAVGERCRKSQIAIRSLSVLDTTRNDDNVPY
jgi:hypothetical protein